MGDEGVVDGPCAALALRAESVSTLLKNSFHKGDAANGDSLVESSHAFKQAAVRARGLLAGLFPTFVYPTGVGTSATAS